MSVALFLLAMAIDSTNNDRLVRPIDPPYPQYDFSCTFDSAEHGKEKVNFSVRGDTPDRNLTISPNSMFPYGIASSNTFPPAFFGEGDGWRYGETVFHVTFESETFEYLLDVQPHLCEETDGKCLSIRVTTGGDYEEIAKADCEMKKATEQ